jgi:hypothetical protein
MNDLMISGHADGADSPDTQRTGLAAAAAPAGPGALQVPVSLATQKLRLAVTMSGGVSLAVWMGGVAREINLLTQASDLRRRDEGRSLFRTLQRHRMTVWPYASAACTGNCLTWWM